MTSPAPEHRFSDRVENYIRYRPGYPEALLELLRTRAGLASGSITADIGSGTGISSALLLRAGGVVYAVEPNAAMRAAAERLLAGEPGFRSVNGSAAATTLSDNSVDLIVAAQAFHWFATAETRAEFTRILRPGGRIALLWNERLTDTTPFLRGYEALLLRFGTDYASIRHENITPAAVAAFSRTEMEAHAFPNTQDFDWPGLSGRLLSCSYAPAPGHPSHEPMMAGLRALFDAHQQAGQVRFDYRTLVYLGS